MLDFNFEWFEQRDVGMDPVPKQKKGEYPTTGKLADQKISDGVFKQINLKKTLSEEKKKRQQFERNLNKLALFAYEAEEGIDMLENGQNPFQEEVERLLEQISSPQHLLTEVDQLFQ